MTPADFIAWRYRMNVPQRVLGKVLGVTKHTIISWENGKTRIPNWVRYLSWSLVARACFDLLPAQRATARPKRSAA